MKIWKKYKGETNPKHVDYPRGDLAEPVEKLSKDIKFYAELEDEVEKKDNKKFRSVKKMTFLDEPHPLYPHLFTCKVTYTRIEIPIYEINEELNNSVGAYLDENYDIHTRIKHNYELISKATSKERIEEITELKEWELSCIAEKDKRIEEFIKTGVFPETDNWPVKKSNNVKPLQNLKK